MKFLKMYGSERMHELSNPVVEVKKLYKFELRYKSQPKYNDRVLMAPFCEDSQAVYQIAQYVTVMAGDVQMRNQYIIDLINFIKKAPDGSIIKTFELKYGDVDYGGSMVRTELEGEWIMEVI